VRFSDLENAFVAILGMGREGRAVWRQIRNRFPGKPIFMFAESALDEDFAGELNPEIDKFQPGAFDVASLQKFDVLVRSAGISPYRGDMQELRSRGVSFTTASNLWFAENPDAKTICISGTMGKSTCAALLSHLLDCAGIKNCLAGNIGRPMLDCEEADIDWWVIELSSYQLADLEASPDIALLLNLTTEHIDWHGDLEQYQADKLRLAELAGEGRIIANFTDPILFEKLRDNPAVTWFNHADTWMVGEGGVSRNGGLHVSAPASLPGGHNLQNLAAVLTTLGTLGPLDLQIQTSLASFSGLPHRLQLVGEKAGVRYVDDSISTTPVSVTAALQTIGHEGVVLLLGGMDRGLDWSSFATDLSSRPPHAIITLPDNGPKIYTSLNRAGIEFHGGLHQSDNLADAVSLAQSLVPEGGCVLLSPGAPSFPHFRDFEDRGYQFRKLTGIEKSTRSTHKKRPRVRG
jgi:UDP-N-acetylmuramoylalanine--D-glutamate ligase